MEVAILDGFDRYPTSHIVGWESIKNQLFERSGNACGACGSQREDGERGDSYNRPGIKIVPHHKDCNRANNDPSNLILLCTKCHSKVHTRYPNWRYMTDAEILDALREGIEIVNSGRIYIKYELKTTVVYPLNEEC